MKPDKLQELVWSAPFSPRCVRHPHDTRRAARARLSTPLSPLRFRQRHETRQAARACLVCCPLSICRLAPTRHQTSYQSSSGLLFSLPLAFGSHTTPDELQELVCLLLSLHFAFGNDTRPDELQELVWSAALSPSVVWHPHDTRQATRARLVCFFLSPLHLAPTRHQTSYKSSSVYSSLSTSLSATTR